MSLFQCNHVTLWFTVHGLFLPKKAPSQHDHSFPQQPEVCLRPQDITSDFTLLSTTTLLFFSTLCFLTTIVSALYAHCALFRACPYRSELSTCFQCYRSNSSSLLFSHFSPRPDPASKLSPLDCSTFFPFKQILARFFGYSLSARNATSKTYK